MKRFSRIMLLALGFGLVPVLFFSMHGRTAKAQSITAGTTVNSQVELYCPAFSIVMKGANYSCDYLDLVAANGNTSYFFSVPANMTLIVTDLECVTTEPSPGQNGTCALTNPNGNGSIAPSTVLAQAGALSGVHSEAVIGLHLTTGIAFTVPPGVFLSGTPQSAVIQGYLIPTPTTGS